MLKVEQMNLEKYKELESIVPNVPELFLESCIRDSSFLRQEIVKQQRYSLLILMLRNVKYPTTLLPQLDQFLELIHHPPDDNLTNVTPHQIQFISLLVNYLTKNSDVLIEAIRYQFKVKTQMKIKTKPMIYPESKINSEEDDNANNLSQINSSKLNIPNNDIFDFLCYSAIPAIFGHFSSNEHIANSFRFFCTLVGTFDEDIIDAVLTPYYANACTFRFIESIYATFGQPFCHDCRLDTQKVQTDILHQYISPLITAIIQAYPLLPHTHQFLLKFMVRRGRNTQSILTFFLHKFVLPQLLRYIKRTPFNSHYIQLRELAISLKKNITQCIGIIDVIYSPSYFEVPQAFAVFDEPYRQVLLTPADVHVIMSSLVQIDKLPQNLVAFKTQLYLKRIDIVPFWVKVYSNNPKPLDTSFNWRPLVFTNENEISTKNDQEITDMPQQQVFERMYRRLQAEIEHKEKSCVDFLLGNCYTIENSIVAQSLEKQFGPTKYKLFVDFVINEEVKAISQRSRVFEMYLVHKLAVHSLKEWQTLVEANYVIMLMPIAQNKMEALLNNKVTINHLTKQIHTFRNNQSVNGDVQKTNVVTAIEDLMKHAMCENVDIPIIRQLMLMTIIHKILHLIVPNDIFDKLKALEKMWSEHLMQIRQNIILPDAFKNTKDNQRTARLLNKALWASIEHLCCLKLVKFEWSLNLIFDTLNELDELTQAVAASNNKNNLADNSQIDCYSTSQNENSIMQFAIAFCDTPLLISRFVIINIFVIKQKIILRTLTNENKDLLLWSMLESSILKILSRNDKLMTSFLSFQDELNFYQL